MPNEKFSPIIVIGNKLDLIQEREISNSMVDFKSQIYTSENLYVSAKTGQNVEESFDIIFDLFFK